MNKEIEKIVLTGLFLAIGIILPPLFHSVQLGAIISPMHFPVLICGLMLGWKYGLICGLLTPLMVSVMFSVPPLFPVAAVMSVELGIYGLMSGLLYYKIIRLKNQTVRLYTALVIAMLVGRIAYGLTYALLFVLSLSEFAFTAYVTSLFVTGLPGIVLQILVIPGIVLTLEKQKSYEQTPE